MNSISNIVAIIPVRGGSKRIKNKNIKLLNGKPLLYYTLDLARRNKSISETFVTTECDTIISMINKYNLEFSANIKIIKRPIELAQDGSTTEDTLIHAINSIKEVYKYIMLLPVTAPFRRDIDIDSLVDIVTKYNADSGQTISQKKLRIGVYEEPYYNYEISSQEINMRKLKLKCVENSCIYLFRPEILLETGRLQGKKNVASLMDMPYDLDINDMYDWYFAECLIERNLINE